MNPAEYAVKVNRPTLSQLETRFVDLMIEQAKLGRPYVWGGKGDRLWVKGFGDLPPSVIDTPPEWGGDVFDCAGLIATMLYRAGGPDVRFTHRAKDLQAEFPQVQPGVILDLTCRFYPGHIAFTLMNHWPHVVIIEAAGGDSATLAPASGRVRWGRERRTDFLAELSLSGWLRSRGYT